MSQGEGKAKSQSGRKLILLVALGTAAVAGAGLWFWSRIEPPKTGELTADNLLRPGNPEFEKYRALVGLEVRKSTLSRNFAGMRVVMVSGSLHNRADQWLEAVQLQITLRSGGQPVLQQTRMAVAPGSRTKPLAPQSDSLFTVWIEQIPPDWSGSAPDVEISGLKFSKFSN